MNLVEKDRLTIEVAIHYFSQLKKIHLKIPYQNDLHTKRDLSKNIPIFSHNRVVLLYNLRPPTESGFLLSVVKPKPNILQTN